ncbi:MAG TPA: hypothetical protein VNS34_04225 [Rhizobiaceae bacterium]|nr:hypothetical protein [Rhizobiaceae bacterium]
MRGVADQSSYGTADELAASLSSGSIVGLTPNLYGNYEDNLQWQRAIDADDRNHRYPYRKFGQILAKMMLRKGDVLADALYGFGSGQGGFGNRAKNAWNEVLKGVFWNSVGETGSRPAKAGWERVKNQMDLDKSPVGRKVSQKIEKWAPAARDAFLDVAGDRVDSWMNSIAGEAGAKPVPPPETSNRAVTSLPPDEANRQPRNTPESVGLPANPLAARFGPRQAGSSIALSMPQRMALIEAAQHRAGLPADWRERVIRDVMSGVPQRRQPLEITIRPPRRQQF